MAGYLPARNILAALAGAVCSFCLFAAYLAVPVVGVLSVFIAPFPAIFSRLKHGVVTALFVTVLASIALWQVFGRMPSLLFLVQCGAISIAVPELMLRGKSISRAVVWTTALNITLLGLMASAVTLVTGTGIHEMATREIAQSVSQAAVIYEKSGVTGEDLKLVKSAMDSAVAVVTRIYPALVTLTLAAVAGVNALFTRRLIDLSRGVQPEVSLISRFRVPEYAVWPLIASGFALLLKSSIVSVPALNVLILLLAAYLMQGVAVVTTIIARQPFAGVIRLCFYLMMIFQPYLLAIVAAIGVFDLWGDFRTPKKQENL